MIIGIDASNIRGGGGITYLVELLRAAKPEDHGFESLVVFGGTSTLGKLDDQPWLIKVHDPLLDKSLPYRLFWQKRRLDKALDRARCDVVYVPGSTYSGSFRPFVTISRNMLPFEWREAQRYGVSWQLLRITLLRWAQTHTFLKANGVIFLTEYARKRVMAFAKDLRQFTVIPHGVSTPFFRSPNENHKRGSYTALQPCRILYVSTIDLYKHQWNVAEAVARLDKAQLPVRLDLIGPAYAPALRRLKQCLERVAVRNSCITYHGSLPNHELCSWYHGSDLFVFASSCENMPNTLLEAMAAGLPIACSRVGPMPEVLGDAGIYFDPESPEEIADAIFLLMNSPALRSKISLDAYNRARSFSWDRCANETFHFLRNIFGEVRQ